MQFFDQAHGILHVSEPRVAAERIAFLEQENRRDDEQFIDQIRTLVHDIKDDSHHHATHLIKIHRYVFLAFQHLLHAMKSV